MLFRLCNAPSTFQTFINKTLREYLNNICTAYLNNVLIYTYDNNKAAYKANVLKVLTKIRDTSLYLDSTKCKFKVKKVKYLSLILTTDSIEIDSKKVSIVLKQQVPYLVKDI